MSLMSTLNMSTNAMGVHQNVISIVSNNISNMNTEGYHKQKANLGTLVLGIPINNSVNTQVKTSAGVEMINVERYTTTFIGSYYRDQLTNQSYLNQKADGMQDIADMFDELSGRGLDTALADFYKALDNLNQYPSDMSARVNFLDSASTLTNSMNLISNNLDKIKTKSVGDGVSQKSLENSDLYAQVTSINDLLSQIKDVNKMLITSQGGTLDNNNLLDRRDALINQLAQLGNFTIDTQANGTVNVSLQGTRLVGGAEVLGTIDVQTASSYDDYCKLNGIDNTNECNAVLMIKKSNGTIIQNANKKFTSGTIGGIIEGATSVEGVTINSVQNSLNTLAKSIADVFNELQTREGAFYIETVNGENKLSNTDLDKYTIFVTNDGTADITASNISINSLLTEEGGYKKIAAAYFENYDPNNPDSFDVNAVGNANNIIAMLNTKTDNTSKGFDDIGNIAFSDYYSGLLSKIVSGTKAAQNSATAQDNVVTSLDNKAAEQTSVDLNEELSDLIRFQTAYNASARVFSTCNTLLDTLISLGR